MYLGSAWVMARVSVMISVKADGIGIDGSSFQLTTLTTNTPKMYLRKFVRYFSRPIELHWSLL